MNIGKRINVEDIKLTVVVVALLLFPIYWVHYGFDFIKNWGVFKEFISAHTGLDSIFSWDALEFAIFYFAILVYPIYLAWIIISAIYDKQMVLVLLNRQWILYLLISPPLIVLGIISLFLGRIIVGIILWSLFLGYPIYLLFKWVSK